MVDRLGNNNLYKHFKAKRCIQFAANTEANRVRVETVEHAFGISGSVSILKLS